MRVTHHTDFASLAPWRATWNELARGVPFRRWEWLEAWWRHYGCGSDGRPLRHHELYVLASWSEDEKLLGLAPWYRLHTRSGGSVVRFLGDGEVCTDYLSILCRPHHADSVTTALAEWLSAAGNGASTDEWNRWDRLELTGVDAADDVVPLLLEHLQQHGSVVHRCAAPNGWRVALPGSWPEYLTKLSKPHRNRLRRAQRRYFESGRIRAHPTHTAAEAFEVLVDLHQRRWRRRGKTGCFASRRFLAFHREVSNQLSALGQATIQVIELDGRPTAAEYLLWGDDTVYAYQSGIDPDRLDDQPGHLANMASLRQAIECGQRTYDFLRGDEAYKAHWRAVPRPMLSVRVVPPRAAARLRHTAWLAGQNVKQWIKSGLQLTTDH